MEIDNWYDATDNGKFKVIKKMIDNGFDVTFDHDYAFRMAAYKGSLKLMTLLLENGANINVNQSYALRTSIHQNNIDCVKFLTKWGAFVSKKSLEIAIDEENMEIAEFLIESGTDLDVEDNKLLFKCIMTGDYNFVKYLLEKNISLHFETYTSHYLDPIMTLMENDEFEIIEMILKKGIEPHKFFLHAMYCGKQLIKLLCEYGLDHNKINLKYLENLERDTFDDLVDELLEITELLLQIGTDPHKLFPYVVHGGMKIINLLHKSGFNEQKLNINELYEMWTEIKWGPIMWIIENKNYEVVRTLLKFGIETHQLFPYAIYGGRKMIKLLCEYGLDLKKIDDDKFCNEWNNCYYVLNVNELNKIKTFVLENDFSEDIKEEVSSFNRMNDGFDSDSELDSESAIVFTH